MADKLAFLIRAATPERPGVLVTPLLQALAARALGAEVEIHFVGPAARWPVHAAGATAFVARTLDPARRTLVF